VTEPARELAAVDPAVVPARGGHADDDAAGDGAPGGPVEAVDAEVRGRVAPAVAATGPATGPAAEPDDAAAGPVPLTSVPDPLLEGYLEAALTVVRTAPTSSLPGPLRGFATWAPRKLHSQRVLAMVKRALETEPEFRATVDGVVLGVEPRLAGLLRAGRHADALASGEPPETVARVGIALGQAGWSAVRAAIDRAELDEAQAAAARSRAATEEVQAELSAARARAEAEVQGARAAREQARAAAGELRRAERERRRLQARVHELEEELRAARSATEAVRAEAAAERRRLQARLTEQRALLEAAQRANRSLRKQGQADPAVVEAVGALDRDLTSLRRAVGLDVDPVAAAAGAARRGPARREPLRVPGGRTADEPETLLAWADAPGVLILVDGYNVTKHPRGFPDRGLEDQRTLLLARCRRLVRRGNELTVVFDGAEVGPLPTTRLAMSGIGVVFTDAGRTADDEIVARVNAEPAERPVVVVSSDNEVRERAAALGANVARAPALLGLGRR
jgi:predicted RNA-binding protein with PIN domain